MFAFTPALNALRSTVAFSPKLPTWKERSISMLGFGLLNKIVLQFSEVFWDADRDYFGHVSSEEQERGECFMFWNLERCMRTPVLVSLVAGDAAHHLEDPLAAEAAKVRVMDILAKVVSGGGGGW
jgi:monoamine oxidase